MRRTFLLVVLLIVFAVTAAAQNPATRVIRRGSEPVACSEGDIYVNTSTHIYRICPGGTWAAIQTAATTPGGSSGDIQYNNAGSFGGIGSTGTGNVARATSPTFVTPTLGVAGATSINKVAITAPASGATITIADGKTFTLNNSITFAGTDSTVMTFPTTSATIARTDADNNFSTGQTIARGSVTSGSGLSLTSTWTGGGTFPGSFFLNVTDTSSNAASLLMDLQVGGVSKFNVRKDGMVTMGTVLKLVNATIQNFGGGAMHSDASLDVTSGRVFGFVTGGLGTARDAAIARPAAKVIQATDGSTGGGAVMVGDVVGSRPTCSVTIRGAVWVTQATGGNGDILQVCMKGTADTYSWRDVFTAP